MKGIVNVEGRPVLINAVQRLIHDPIELVSWPSSNRESNIVFITRGIDRREIEPTLAALGYRRDPRGARLDPERYASFVSVVQQFRTCDPLMSFGSTNAGSERLQTAASVHTSKPGSIAPSAALTSALGLTSAAIAQNPAGRTSSEDGASTSSAMEAPSAGAIVTSEDKALGRGQDRQRNVDANERLQSGTVRSS